MKWLRRAMYGCFGAVAALAVWMLWPLPDEIAHPRPVASVVLADRHGLPLRTTRSSEGTRGGWLPIEQFDADVIRAFVAAEDQRFYDHNGVDIQSMARALRDNLMQRDIVSGASTITMQTARLLIGTDRTLAGKLAQIAWAWRIDAQMSKSAILEAYLNRVPLGQGTVGVPAAAALYFGASAGDLSVGQAAVLAGSARRPARDNALASPERARARRTVVLQRMQRRGYIDASVAGFAALEPVTSSSSQSQFLAPHFTTRVLSRMDARSTGEQVTTLDLALQTSVEAEVRHTVDMLRDRMAAHAAAVVLDNNSGDVLAWVGSPDFFAEKSGQVDMVVSRRQPGSALKPFLYGLAFDRGFTAATVLPDVPRTYATATGGYKPQNYDRRFRGPVRTREALASSYNVPAVELAQRLGTTALLHTLNDAGFESLDRSADHYGLGLALGNGDVTLIELANAYRGITNGGAWRPYRTLLNENGAPQMNERRFMTTSSAALVLDILSDPMARIPGFGSETPLDFPFRAATKTGTSRHYTDNWAVATTARFTVAVWVGNFDGQPMQKVSGITGAGPLLHRVVLQTAKRYPPGTLVDPERAGLNPAQVCILSGMLATRDCPSMIEWFAPGTEPREHDTWQIAGRTALPSEYAEWSATSERSEARLVSDVAPGEHGVMRIVAPRNGDVYERPVDAPAQFATLPLVATNASRVKWTVDGKPLRAPRWRIEKGSHVIRATWASGVVDSVRVTVD